MKKRAFIYIIAAGILWGTSGIFVKLLSPYGFSSFQLTAWRGIVSLVIIALFLLIRNRKRFRVRPLELLLFACNGVALFGTAGCYFASMQATSISTAVILMYTAPVLVMMFSVAFLGERFTKLKLVSVVCMLIGCALVSGVVGGLTFHAYGILMGLLSGISYSVYNILAKIEMRRNCDPLSATLYGALFMSVIAVCISKPQEMIAYTVHAPLKILPLVLCMGVVTFVLPYFLYTSALKELPAGTSSALAIVEPMAATLFGIALFREPLDWTSAVGIVLILFAVFLLSRAEHDPDSHTSQSSQQGE